MNYWTSIYYKKAKWHKTTHCANPCDINRLPKWEMACDDRRRESIVLFGL